MIVSKNRIVLYGPRIVPSQKATETLSIPPLSLLAVSSPLLQEKFDIKILDGNLSDDTYLSGIDPESILCVGITAMTGYQLKDGLQFAKKIRGLDSRIPIVWGGVHVSLLPEQSIQNGYVDIIVIGQGEETFLYLVKAFDEGLNLAEIDGIYYKQNGTIRANKRRPLVDIQKYPILPYHLINMDRYAAEIKTNKNLRISGTFDKDKDIFMYYYSSVGCPYACRFCASSKHSERRWIGFSVDRVLNEIEYLIKKYKVTFIHMVDTEFFIDIERALKIAQGFIDRKFNIGWKAQIRANSLARLKDEEVQLLKKSGYFHAEIGVESGSPRMLEYIDKKITVEQVIECAQILKRNDILGSFLFVFGFPGETKQDIKKSFKLASELKKIMLECLLPIYFFNPYPGVPIYEDAIKLGLKPPDSMEAWGNINFELKLNCQLVPWLNRRYVDYCHKVIVFYLPLAFPADIKFGTITYMKTKLKKSKFRLIWFLLHKLALIRVKYQFFDFPFEWFMYKTYLRFTGRKSW